MRHLLRHNALSTAAVVSQRFRKRDYVYRALLTVQLLAMLNGMDLVHLLGRHDRQTGSF